MKAQAIHHHSRRYPIRLMCRALMGSPAGYYAWRDRPESDQSVRNRTLLSAIRMIHGQSRHIDRSPSTWQALVQRGHREGEHRVARLMRTDGIRAKTVKKWRATIQSRHRLPVAANRFNCQFTVTKPARAWAGDITYVWTRDGWFHLTVVLELHSCAVTGWAMGGQLTRALTQQALTMAIHYRTSQAELLHPSDRDSQYVARGIPTAAHPRGMTGSMSRRRRSWDNAPVESFFGALKGEIIYHRQYRAQEEATQAILEYIEVFYNRLRRHSTLGYYSPVEFEARTAVA